MTFASGANITYYCPKIGIGLCPVLYGSGSCYDCPGRINPSRSFPPFGPDRPQPDKPVDPRNLQPYDPIPRINEKPFGESLGPCLTMGRRD